MKSHADRVTRARNFTAARAWGAPGIAQVNDITARLHRTHDPCKWHVNDGDDVFTVMDGRVDLHVRRMGGITVGILGVGDVFYASVGCEHVAHPPIAARILVVEKNGSV
jgi:mannose-6-phosphate isomerase-like protein (cupin superfamily)